MPAKKKAAAKKSAPPKAAAKKAAPKKAAPAPVKPAPVVPRRGPGPQSGDLIEGVLVNGAPGAVATVVSRVGPRAWRVTLVGGAHDTVVTAVKSGVWTTRDGA